MARSGVSSQRSTRGRPCAASRARNPLSERALMQDGTHTCLPAREPSIDLSEPDQLVRTVTASLEGRWPSPSFWIPPGRFDCYLRRRSSSECERAHRTASHARIHARAVVAAGSDRPHVRAGQTGDDCGAWDEDALLRRPCGLCSAIFERGERVHPRPMASRALGRATLPPQQHRRFRSAHSFSHSVIACAARLPLAWQSARMPCAVLGYMRCAQVVQLRCRCVYHSGCLKSDRTNQPFLRCERVRGGYEFRVLTGYSVVLTAYGVGMGLGSSQGTR
jgi:hypothetical protein